MKCPLFLTPLYSGAAPSSPQHTEFFTVCTVLKCWNTDLVVSFKSLSAAMLPQVILSAHFCNGSVTLFFGIAHWRSPRISCMKWAIDSDISVFFTTTYIAFEIIRSQRSTKIDEIVTWTQKYIVYNLFQRIENRFKRHGKSTPDIITFIISMQNCWL